MARRTIGERLARLEAQRKTLQMRLGKQERAIDTRRKILIGALVLHRLEHEGDTHMPDGLAAWLRTELPKFLLRDADRSLFNDLLTPQGEDQLSTGDAGAHREANR